MKKIKFKFVNQLFGYRNNLLICLIILIIFSKLIRYTVLKVTLVDAGIGHKMLTNIINHSSTFSFFGNGESADPSGNACLFFEKINIFNLTTYTDFEIFITIIWNLMLVIILLGCKKKYDTLQSLFLVISIMALNIFDFTLAKEPIQFLYFFLMFIILNNNTIKYQQKLFCMVCCILLCALTFRSYYILILYFGIIFFILYTLIIKDNKITFFKMFLVLAIIGISYYLCLYIARLVDPSIYFELIRVRHRQSTATTDIRALFTSNNLIIYMVDYVIVLFRLLFPIELIRFGPKFLLYIFCQLIITFTFLKTFFNMKNLTPTEKIATYIYIGYLLTSACFEPDFGSWVRHESTVFPVTVFLSGIMKK